MKARYVEPWIHISTTITDREPISRWGRIRPTRDPFSRRAWDQSWRCRRSADCTTATNDGPPERAGICCYALPLPQPLKPVPLCAHCTRIPLRIPFTRLKQVREGLDLRGSLGE